MQVVTFEGCRDVVHRQQKNVRDNVEERLGNRLLSHNRLLICFQLNISGSADATIDSLASSSAQKSLTEKGCDERGNTN